VKTVRLKNIDKICDAINSGLVLICPTDTVYGLICDASNEKSVEKIFKIKMRPREKALPVFVADIEGARKLAFINNKQEEIIRQGWPGKKTFVLKRKLDSGLAENVFSRKDTIALRQPDSELIKNIILKTGKFLIGTSANISGQPSSTKISEVLGQFENKINLPDIVIDAGDLPESQPSSIIDLTKGDQVVLRE
jgi:L-threonylcarbamoyladenylate synthase